nr:bifunctional 3'-5' exonuclease/DNA polymerase [Nakamurella flava]
MLATAQTGAGDHWRVQDLDARGDPLSSARSVGTAELRDLDTSRARWVCRDLSADYPPLWRAGVSLSRAHDLAATDRILRARAGDVTAVPDPAPALPPLDDGPGLFDAVPGPRPPRRRAAAGSGADRPPAGIGGPDDARRQLVDQLAHTAGDGALRLLVAAESSAGLSAVEMTAAGLPWRADRHRELLDEVLGARPGFGQRPPRLAALVTAIGEAFGFPVNPDSPLELRSALSRVGYAVESTRSSILREIPHPVVPLLLDYKERARLFTANGWDWLDTWVRDGRFRPEYVPGGVVSGRWASRGGGALQIPRALRRAVVADPGHRLIVADAAQAEPRVLAAVSGDTGLRERAAAADLYDALAADGFGGDRARAKLSLLGAMYGATTGESGRLLPTLRRLYPQAMGHLQRAADEGARGGTVTSVLGRACPPPSPSWRSTVEIGTQPDATAAERSRADRLTADRSRFTRNFVIQASAADWASVWLAQVRQALGPTAVVLFQHDEIVLHVPESGAADAAAAVTAAADSASALVFPGTGVRIPVDPAVVDSYADKT